VPPSVLFNQAHRVRVRSVSKDGDVPEQLAFKQGPMCDCPEHARQKYTHQSGPQRAYLRHAEAPEHGREVEFRLVGRRRVGIPTHLSYRRYRRRA